jgi:hypothetical protein
VKNNYDTIVYQTVILEAKLAVLATGKRAYVLPLNFEDKKLVKKVRKE